MPNRMQIMVCDSPANAIKARQFLIKEGFPDAQITDETVGHLVYDATTYDGGKVDNLVNKILVTGRM